MFRLLHVGPSYLWDDLTCDLTTLEDIKLEFVLVLRFNFWGSPGFHPRINMYNPSITRVNKEVEENDPLRRCGFGSSNPTALSLKATFL